MAASILQIIVTQNTIFEKLVGFPKSGHMFLLMYVRSYAL